MTISESRDTSSLDVYAERSQARRESVKDSPTRSALPLATEGTQERPENDGESGKFCRSLLFEHELNEFIRSYE